MQKETVSLAIVGKNLYSCVAALHLRDKLGSKLAWFQTLRDPEFDGDDQFIILTPLQRNQMKISMEHEVLTDNPKVFVGSHRHYPLDHILKFLRTDLTDCPYLMQEHPSVIAKAVAVGLWNDLSPAVLDNVGNPRPEWIHEIPPTSKDWEAGAYTILKRKHLFQATERALTEKKVRVDFDKRRVLGIDRSSFNEGFRLIFNAPFGAEPFQALLWTSLLYSVKDEGQKKTRTESLPQLSSLASWETFAADVPTDCVGYLPLLSVWIAQDEAGKAFRKTGLAKSGAIRRVICLPIPETSKCRLQIQALHFHDNPRVYSRPDEFLWEFCPLLKQHRLAFQSSKAEENLVFASPFSHYHKIANRFDFWTGGVDCAFSKVPKFQWGIDSRRRKREIDQPASSQV
jgi:hypothetical protein